MNSKVLISSPDEVWSRELQKALQSLGMACDYSLNGKDAQLKVYKIRPDIVLLDFDLTKHSSIEVLKYINLTHPGTKVFLCLQSKQRAEEARESGFDEEGMKRVGVEKAFVRPFATQTLVKFIEDLYRPGSWRTVAQRETVEEEKESRLSDTEFTRIKIEDFLTGKLAIFDYYIKLRPNCYKKILHRGEVL